MPISTLFQKSSQFVLDFVFPPHCISCKTADDWLCQNCLRKISFIADPICPRCGLPTSIVNSTLACKACVDYAWQGVDGIRAVAHFEDTPIRQAIHVLKYHNHRAVVSILGMMLTEAYQRYQLEVEIVVPVPLHPLRFKERGYNQSELLAKTLGRSLNLAVNTQTLQRIRYTEAQVNLDFEARRKNVIDAFLCCNQDLAKRTILLIDDVCTTGSTLDACAVALKESGAYVVWGLTLAH